MKKARKKVVQNKKKSPRVQAQARMLAKSKPLFQSKRFFIVLAGITIVLAITAFVVFKTRTKTEVQPTTASILIDTRCGSAEAWSDFLPRIAKELGLREVKTKTFSADSELLEIFSRSKEKEPVLFAETAISPVVFELISQQLAAKMPEKAFDSIAYYSGYLSAINKEYLIPLSWNPWIAIRYKDQNTPKPQKAKAAAAHVFSLPGKEDESCLAAFALAGGSLDVLAKTQKSGILQRNAFSYNLHDAFFVMLDKKAEYAFTSYAYFRSLPLDTFMQIEPCSLPPIKDLKTEALIASGTVLLVPAKQKHSSQTIQKLVSLTSAADLVYAVTRSANTLPAMYTAPIQDYYSNQLREKALSSRQFVFTGKLYQTAEKEALLENIRVSLMSR